MIFEVTGPFVLKRYGAKKILNKESLSDLKEQMEIWQDGLSDACGCYVFAIRAGKGFTPYYVGQACKRSIHKEALNPSNISKYNTALSDSNGTPVLFCIPLMTNGGKFRKRKQVKGGLAALDFLEQWLIAAAIEKNEDLINNKETFFLRNLHVRGIFNAQQGEANYSTQSLTKTLWR
jgi:hypothetical protein